MHRSGDGVSVVATEEKHRAFQRGGEVEGGVEVPLTSSTITEIANHDILLFDREVLFTCHVYIYARVVIS